MDRGYAKFALFNAIAEVGSSYVCRLRDNSVYEIVEAYPLSPEAQAAGVLFDGLVLMGQDREAAQRPNHPGRSNPEGWKPLTGGFAAALLVASASVVCLVLTPSDATAKKPPQAVKVTASVRARSCGSCPLTPGEDAVT